MESKCSPIRKLPSGWEVKKIKQCFKFKNGKGFSGDLKEKADNEYRYPVYGGNGIIGYCNTPLLNNATIIVGRVGEYCGNVFKTQEKSWVTDNAMLVSEVLLKDFDINFWTVMLNSLHFNHYSDSTGQPKITQGGIGAITMAYPKSAAEQTAIANILSKVDVAITSVQNSIYAAERLKKSLMQNLLTGKMKPDGTLRTPHEFYVDEKFGKVPVGWNVKRVDEVFNFYPTASYSRSMLKEDGECKYIHYGDIHTRFDTFLDISEESLPYITNDMIKKFVLLKDGDIVISDTSEDYDGVGKLVELINVGESKVISGLHTLLLRPKTNELINGFKGYLFNEERVRLEFLKYVTGIKVYSISKNSLSKVLIPIPTRMEQEQIKQKLDTISKDILASKYKTGRLERLKNSLMQNLLTGRVRLNKTIYNE